MSLVKASILDFPRKTLPKELWVYDNMDDLPSLNPTLRELITSTAADYLKRYNMELKESMLYGGAASYQWSPGADIDVSLYAEDWPEGVSDEEAQEIQAYFAEIKIPFEGYEIHFFLKPPNEKPVEVADAVYDIIRDEWALPPLVLPQGFDPDDYFAPLIRSAEKKAEKFDLKIGELRRSWTILKKSSEAKHSAREPDLVEERIEEEKQTIKKLVKELARDFIRVRENRYAMHDRLREKLKEDQKLSRFERFQEPEIIWKYLDRSGYNDFLWKLYKLDKTDMVDNQLAKF